MTSLSAICWKPLSCMPSTESALSRKSPCRGSGSSTSTTTWTSVPVPAITSAKTSRQRRREKRDRAKRGARAMTDDEFISQFESCTLANEAFHHRDHIRVVWLYLRRYSVLETLARFSEGL